MIQINQLKLPIRHTPQDLEARVRKQLKLAKNVPLSCTIQKRSIDARKKPELFYVYTLLVKTQGEEKLVKRAGNANVRVVTPDVYQIPARGEKPLAKRPVIIGAGPAGLFCAYVLTEAGYQPLVLERGRKVEDRQKDVAKFWETGILDTASNVQFGEGGAGTFSDGKLNTAVKDVLGRNHYVLETFVRFGASPDILIDAKPHIGTDVLSEVIRNMRQYLLERGCCFRYETRVFDFLLQGQKLSAVICSSPDCAREIIDTDLCVLAIGHSSRDTFSRLHALSIPMTPKNFAVGFRVEHPQSMINDVMYGHQTDLKLPASPYKVTANFPNGRGVYSFCMCPGGYVVNSSSEKEGTVVNGMSYSGRSGANANSAIIVSVTTADFGAEDPMAGIRFQEKLEHETWLRGKGAIPQQLFGDYRQGCESSAYGEFDSCTRGKTVFAGLNGLFSRDMELSFCRGMEQFARMVPGFDRPDAILSGVESRTSSPVRILRDEALESEIRGIYPCGEGAGYAGGITSAAMDGMKVAEAIIKKYTPSY